MLTPLYYHARVKKSLHKNDKEHGKSSMVLCSFILCSYTRLRASVSRIQAMAIHLVEDARTWSKPPFLFLLR